jgi:hypothetical protein
MGSAADRVWALVSGLPSGKRERRRLMILQACADDSGNEPRDPIFVFGGFVSPVAKWVEFADAWQEVLDETPKLEYFKMSEAASLAKQWHKRKGWTEATRDKRLSSFIKVIKQYAEVAVHISIRHDDFNSLVASIPLPQRRLSSDKPYPLLATQFMLSVAALADTFNAAKEIEFVFDEQLGYSDEMLAWWPVFREFAESGARTNFGKYLKSPPDYRSDRCFLPLQAADLFSWQQRLHEKNNQVLTCPKNWVLRELDSLPILGVPIGEKPLGDVREMLLRMGERFAAANPGIPFVPASKKARRQTRRKERDKRKETN